MNNHKGLGLLNYEGYVLKMKKTNDDQFVIYDQWQSIVETLSRDELFEFLLGLRTVTDSSGKIWNWTEQHSEAKTSLLHILEYIKTPSANYTKPGEVDKVDPKDLLNTTLLFSRALSLILHEGEGVAVNVVGDIDLEGVKKVVVFHKEGQVHVMSFDDRPDIEEGEYVTICDFSEN